MSFGRRLPPSSHLTTPDVATPDAPATRRRWGRTILYVVLAGFALAGLDLAGGWLLTRAPSHPTAMPVVPSGPLLDDSVLKAFPDTKVAYYDVPGTDIGQMQAYMNDHGPVDSHDGFHGDGRTTWSVNWLLPASAAGCDPSHAVVHFHATVLLPRAADEAAMTPDVAQTWHFYLSHLILHESGHLRHAYQRIGDIATAMHGQTCANANAAAQAAIKKLGEFDVNYDRVTQHGLRQGNETSGI